MKYLGIDYGTKTIGLATGSDETRVAFPHSTVPAGPEALDAIEALCQAEGIGAVVVGESRDLAGAPNPVMAHIERFAQELSARTGLQVHFEREFFTSALAARQFAPEEGSRKQHPAHAKLDASAAALILQSFLDRQK